MTNQHTATRAVASERVVSTNRGNLFVNDQAGSDPAIVMMHGFPDDHRVYDRLAPYLQPNRVVTFDWFGYGRSGRREPFSARPSDHQDELASVLDELRLAPVVLVAHDAAGPDAIDFALNNPTRVEHLILLDCYYGNAPALRLPEMIRLLADERLAPLADAMLEDELQRLWLLQHTARRFGADPTDPTDVGTVSVLPQFFGDARHSDAMPAIRAWIRDLFASLDRQDSMIADGRLAALDTPVTLIFGARDEFLSPKLADHIAGLFHRAEVHLIDDASHWPQWDQPETVARLIHATLA